jgi:hypothetical protein
MTVMPRGPRTPASATHNDGKATVRANLACGSKKFRGHPANRQRRATVHGAHQSGSGCQPPASVGQNEGDVSVSRAGPAGPRAQAA